MPPPRTIPLRRLDSDGPSGTRPAGGYGFHGRLRPEFPLQVQIDVTEVCNLACTHCAHPVFRRSSDYAARMLDPALNRKLVTEVARFGRGVTRYLRYTGEGEPLLHPALPDMLADAVRRSGVFVSLTTNGTLLTERLGRRLLETGVDLIDVSLDAFSSETYAKIRVKGRLAETRDQVLTLLGHARRHAIPAKIVVSYVEQAANRSETEAFVSFWRSAGADDVVVRRLHSNAGTGTEAADELRRQMPARRPCLYPWERVILKPRGTLAFCPNDWHYRSELADYRTVSIRDLWQGPAYESLRDAHLTNRFDAHGFCGGCPDWRQTRWPHEGRSYADMILDFSGERGAVRSSA